MEDDKNENINILNAPIKCVSCMKFEFKQLFYLNNYVN